MVVLVRFNKMAKIISAVALSGGQGKTTLVFFLSLLLAEQGNRVLAIDANPQPDLTLYLGCELEPNDPSLLEVLTGKVTADDAIYETSRENLFILPADRALSQANTYLSSSGTGASILKQRLKTVRDEFDYILIDPQPSESQISLSVVGATEILIVPFEATTKGHSSTIDTLEFLDMRSQLEAFNGQILGVVPFRDKWAGRNRTKESRQAIEDVAEMKGDLRMFPSIRESEPIKRCLSEGELLTEGHDLQYPLEQISEALKNG